MSKAAATAPPQAIRLGGGLRLSVSEDDAIRVFQRSPSRTVTTSLPDDLPAAPQHLLAPGRQVDLLDRNHHGVEHHTGLRGLLTRGWIHATGIKNNTVAWTWTSPDAETAALRLMGRTRSVAFQPYNLAARNVEPHKMSEAELLACVAWHYRDTTTSHLRLRLGPHSGTVIEHRLDGTSTTQSLAGRVRGPRLFWEEARWISLLAENGAASYGRPWFSHGVWAHLVWHLLRRLRRRLDPGEVLLDLDRWTAHLLPAGTGPELGAAISPLSFTATAPAVLADTLDRFAAPTFTTAAEFTGWADANLLLRHTCGGTRRPGQTRPTGSRRHTLHLNPHTHATADAGPHPEAAALLHSQIATLHGLGDTTILDGCARARDALSVVGDRPQYDVLGFSAAVGDRLYAARTIARAVQYLDAGLDLRAAAPFLRFGIPTAYTARLVSLRLAADRGEPGRDYPEALMRLRQQFTKSLPEDVLTTTDTDLHARLRAVTGEPVTGLLAV